MILVKKKVLLFGQRTCIFISFKNGNEGFAFDLSIGIFLVLAVKCAVIYF